MDSARIVRLWAAAAWADGRLHPAEEAALRRFIDASDDLDAAGRQAALALIEKRPDIDVEEVRALEPVAREGVYRAVRGIVKLDGKVTTDEVDWISKLKARLDLDAKTIARIEAEG